MKTLLIPAHFYPDDSFTGDALRAPLGLPVDVVESRTSGRGKNKITRVLVRSAAPAGWGAWSSRAFYAWVEPDAIKDQSKEAQS